MARITIQKGHCFRTTGVTGGRGEQTFADSVGTLAANKLTAVGHDVVVVLADQDVPDNRDVFVAVHTDGSANTAVHGASVGYPADSDGRLAHAWKRHWQRLGYRWGYHPDNYTTALRRYYGFGRAAGYRHEFLAEFGMHSNAEEFSWLHSNYEKAAESLVAAIGEVVGHPRSTTSSTEVRPMYDPPLKLAPGVGIVASLVHPQGLGSMLLLSDGGTWEFGPPACGSVINKEYMKPDHRPVRLKVNPKWEQAGRPHAGTLSLPWYVIVDQHGHEYGHSGF